ncbi:MAG TPA: UDP-N-acetylglucosamine 2-epimerase [Candidatus Acidoferrum sp.]|nr:UDP-N-acetylglucosamine 2-epimerase [Candidatus Acidoferrum sp.]
MQAKSLLFVTGTRADYGKIEPLAQAAKAAGCKVGFFITGMHMLAKYGETRIEVRRFEGADFFEYVNQRHGDPQDVVLAKTILGFSDWLAEYKPDLVIIHGDRIEALAVALVCATRYVPCAHVEGGELSGTIDEIYRHCNSKLCRYHFVSSDAAKSRVVALGENPDDIFVIGSPELDFHGAPPAVTLDDVRKRYDIAFADYGIAVFHPVTSEQNTIGAQARSLFGALEQSGRNFVVISPNNDPGSDDIFAAIAALPTARFRHIPSMRFAYFSTLMRNAAVIVGNSSLGVREAPFLGVPSIDVGTRQHNRANAPSITHADALQPGVIEQALKNLWGKRFTMDRTFGDGGAAERFMQILRSDNFWGRPLQKVFFE